MKFVAKLPDANVNVSSRNPLSEFVLLVGGIGAILIIVYISLGFVASFLLKQYDEEVMSALSLAVSKAIDDTPKYENQRERLQQIVNKLVVQDPELTSSFKVHVTQNNTINALAFPGGDIVVFSGLLEQVQSENEIAMVLAHELGHYANQDHLDALGRSIVLIFVSVLFLGEDSMMTDFFTGSLNAVHMKFSREQELEADTYGIKLLQKTYGHVGGSTDFFERINKDEHLIDKLFLSTHPLSSNRISRLKRWAKSHKCQHLATIPFNGK